MDTPVSCQRYMQKSKGVAAGSVAPEGQCCLLLHISKLSNDRMTIRSMA